MLEQLKEWDRQLLIFLNGQHVDWLDPVAFWVTKTEFWIPLYIFLIYLIFKQHGKEGWLVLAGAALTVLLADQITASIMKPYFARPRPSHEPALEGLLHIVNDYRGGAYGFASSHAANTSGVALFVFLLFRNVYRWIWVLFLWALIMTYTRIYLGVHYPGDILVGAMVGLLSGYAGFRFQKWFRERRLKPSPSLKEGAGGGMDSTS